MAHPASGPPPEKEYKNPGVFQALSLSSGSSQAEVPPFRDSNAQKYLGYLS